MRERLTDDELQNIASWSDKTQTAASSMADELLVLRARVAKLEAALREIDAFESVRPLPLKAIARAALDTSQ
jgi:hypothetical protein